MSESASAALVDECNRQFENCGYTSTTFHIWLRSLIGIRTFCQVGPIVFGALATWQIVAASSPVLAAVFTFLATVIPPAYRATRVEAAIDEYRTVGGEFTNLRDRFRQAAQIGSQKPWSEFEAEVKPLLDRLEKNRKRMLVPPDWCFRLAQGKHKRGDYIHDHDERLVGKGGK